MEEFFSKSWFFPFSVLFERFSALTQNLGRVSHIQSYTVWLINIWKSFHMVSGTTSGLVGTKYILNWSLELYNLCLVSRIWIWYFFWYFLNFKRKNFNKKTSKISNKNNFFLNKNIFLKYFFLIVRSQKVFNWDIAFEIRMFILYISNWSLKLGNFFCILYCKK
jgi:hypothetical protein